jgi:glycosyltransferase involved in cell wall biosynthesis
VATVDRSTAGEGALERLAAGARVDSIGISIDQPCGVRDHAVLLAAALGEGGCSCPLHWLSRPSTTLAAERADVRSWAQTLTRELQRTPPDVALLHYSVFAFSHRGVPVFVRPVLAALRDRRVPLVTFMHEFAYPWRLGGVRGKVWAATQRLALREVVQASAAIVVSSDARADWFLARPWLPRRQTSVAPVFSNLPAGGARATGERSPDGGGVARVGLFGYAHEAVAVDTVLDALRLLRDDGLELELALLGAPGRASPAGAHWEQAAARRALAGTIGFSGRLPAQDLSDELARCAVLLFAERGGPTSRKTTLAASLDSGRPVVALDGRNSWAELLQSGAAVVVPPDARSLANALARLLCDREERVRQGERGRAFAQRAMSVEQSARIVGDALARAIRRAG